MTGSKKTVGVLGGMGPDATVDFMARVIAATPATVDQDHIHMLVDNDPTIPARQDALLQGGPDPGPAIALMAQRLQTAGADFLVMPCNTAHAYSGAITAAVEIPLLSIIDVTLAACSAFESVGLLATEGCLQAGVYQTAVRGTSTELVLPNDAELREFMALTFRVKQGDRSAQLAVDMAGLADALHTRGAQAIIAGCTEIPLVLDSSAVKCPLISSTDELARQTVALALGEIKLSA